MAWAFVLAFRSKQFAAKDTRQLTIIHYTKHLRQYCLHYVISTATSFQGFSFCFAASPMATTLPRLLCDKCFSCIILRSTERTEGEASFSFSFHSGSELLQHAVAQFH
jgi:hypothetical protein